MIQPQNMMHAAGVQQKPLIIDLDGTLVKSDTLIEQVLLLAKKAPAKIVLLPWWLLQGGKAYCKIRLAQSVTLDPASLPYRQEVVEYARTARRLGRPVILATAASASVAQTIAQYLNLFDHVHASTATHNLKGNAKAQALVEKYGHNQYDYLGNSLADIPVWRTSQSALVVGATPTVVQAIRRSLPAIQVLSSIPTSSRLRMYWKTLRAYQWVKNLLVFLPLILAHNLTHVPTLLAAVIAFASLSLTASATYIINDLLDLAADRQHRWKKHRPFAAGDVSLSSGIATALALLALGFLIAIWFLPLIFAGLLAVYVGSTLAYSLYFKRIVIIDVVLLASLYTLRILLGTAATGIPTSFWLLAFAIFFFLSLALSKRFTELSALPTTQTETVGGRGYIYADRTSLAHLGTGSGYLSVLVLAFYINSEEVTVFYNQPTLLWFICPLLLYWISRLWFLAHRNRLHDDPILFAFRDNVSYIIGILAFVVAIAASY